MTVLTDCSMAGQVCKFISKRNPTGNEFANLRMKELSSASRVSALCIVLNVMFVVSFRS